MIKGDILRIARFRIVFGVSMFALLFCLNLTTLNKTVNAAVSNNITTPSVVTSSVAQGDCYGSVTIYPPTDIGGGCIWGGATATDCNGNGCTCGMSICETPNGVAIEFGCYGGCAN